MLGLLSLSDSCTEVWPDLAREAGLELHAGLRIEELPTLREAVLVIAAPGAERSLEPSLHALAGSDLDIATVGAVPDHRLAVSLIRAGAAEYFSLPEDVDLVRSWLQERAQAIRARFDRQAFAAGEAAKYRFEGIVGESDALRSALDRASRIIPHSSATVLITGETGTGKELLARALHYNGPRQEAPFVDINCAAIPEHLLESELFGHEKGSFTGAAGAKPGLFEVAHGGTVFLDEIGHLSLDLQGKLLRVLEERTIRRVGGVHNKRTDVRVLAATHVDLAAAVRRGEFREDLYYRLNVLPIELPPLRRRSGDVPLLVRHFVSRLAAEYSLPEPILTPATMAALKAHPWQGNVRELRNLVERTVLLFPAAEVDVEALGLTPSPRSSDGTVPFPAALREVESVVCRRMVELCGGNKSEAARRLMISRTRLQRVLDRAAALTADSGDR